MAAGLGFKTFTTGEVLTAADVNGYLMQGILVFANSTARSSAITTPQEGQYSFLKDTNALEYYDGAAWVGAPVGDITAVNAGTGISGGGASGSVTITNDMATTITASGDIVVGTGSGTYDNLPIGTTGQVLTADTTVSPYKVKWAAVSGGDWKLITASTATNVNSHSISSCFSSTYKVYKIYMNLTGTAGSSIAWRGRVGSTDTTTNYNYQLLNVANTTFYNGSTTGGTSALCGDVQTYFSGAEFTIYDPYAAEVTPAHSLMVGDAASARYYTSRQTDSTSFDGITFINSTANFTGTFYVYGLKA